MKIKSLKIRLNLNNKQKSLASQHCGVARHAYNWGLALCKDYYEQGKKHPTAIYLHKLLVKEVKSQHKWYYEVSKYSPQQALRNLDVAFKRFFTKKASRPTFKKKGQRDSFYLEGKILTNQNKIKLPIFGWIKLSENVGEHEIKNVVISRQADQWFVSFKIEFEPQTPVKTVNVVGVDLGIKTLATLSNGTTFPNLRPFKRYKRKLKIEQRKLSKKYVKGREQSENYQKQKLKVSKIHKRIGDIRKDAIHKLTSYLSKNHTQIVIEDLNVNGMVKNHKLASAILDGGFYEFKRQLEYKCEWNQSQLIIVDRFYPSSKTCSGCGHKKNKLKLSERIFECEGCGYQIDRDLNAAINLKNKAASYAVTACGAINMAIPKGLHRNETGRKQQRLNFV